MLNDGGKSPKIQNKQWSNTEGHNDLRTGGQKQPGNQDVNVLTVTQENMDQRAVDQCRDERAAVSLVLFLVMTLTI